jgi:putative colanic acid biosysnthesis UDP-glucose lipid carrier transferase
MFDSRIQPRTYLHLPQTVTAFVASLIDPFLNVFALLGAHAVLGLQAPAHVQAAALLVFALSFPGINRFGQPLGKAMAGLLSGWVGMLAVMGVCGYVLGSLALFDPAAIALWVVAAPALRGAVLVLGRSRLQRSAALHHNRRTAVIIGAGPLGLRVAQALTQSVAHQTQLLGYFDDRRPDRAAPEVQAQLLGTAHSASDYIHSHEVNEVYVTVPLGLQPRIVEMLQRLQGTTADVFFVPDVFAVNVIQGRLRDLHGLPVVGLSETPFYGVNRMVKRASDLVLASAILVLIAPVLLAVAIGVRLSSPGPVIFKQRRTGESGAEIWVYKFRSMRTMDNGKVVQQAKKGDARITPFGAFIRRTSLDELPQFVNVLQGRMSIVGPRPHAVAHNEQYRQLITTYMTRHKIKPGITGWAQVNGWRGETDTLEKMQARVECDLDYMRNWSLLLDLQIIARTAKQMFFDRNAY